MRRFTRWTLNALTALSLLLALAAAAESVRSLWHADRVTWLPSPSSNWSLEVLSNNRGLSVAEIRQNTPRPKQRQSGLSATIEPPASYYFTGFPNALHHHLGGFALDRLSYLDGTLADVTRYSATAPLPFLTLLFALLPLLRLRSHLRPHRRSRVGLCPACAYDLRATPARCPECGTTVADAAANP